MSVLDACHNLLMGSRLNDGYKTRRHLRAACSALAKISCDLTVIGDIPEELRGKPFVLVTNHVGSFDPIIFNAAAHAREIDARILIKGDRFKGTLGALLTAAQHISVDRDAAEGGSAFANACAALRNRQVVGVYPEGRIGLDPDLWPERGKTGAARMALETGVPVVSLAHWGSHEVMPAILNHARRQLSRGEVLARYAQNAIRRPTVRAKFGRPRYFSEYSVDDPEHVRLVTTAIMAGIHEDLLDLRSRSGEVERINRPDLNRLTSTDRTCRFAGAPPLERGRHGKGGGIAT